MITKTLHPIQKRSKSRKAVKISLNFLATLFHLEKNQPFLGVVETIDEGTTEHVPALLNKDWNSYVNLLTGDVLSLSPRTIVYKADVWYIPHRTTFSFMVLDKCLASINKSELIKTFGKDVIV